MDAAQSEVLNCLNHMLHKKPYSICADTSDSFMMLIKKHGLSELLYPVLSASNIDAGFFTDIKKNVDAVFAKNLIYSQQIKQVLEAFREKNIPVIMLKGLSLARFYTHPEYRSMCDLDILVEPHNWTAARDALLHCGLDALEEDDYNPLHVAFGKKAFITVELHRSLIHEGYLGKRDIGEWLQHLWKNPEKACVSGLEFFAMAPEDELINQISHFAAHYVYIGARLRHLYEMALIIHSYESRLDWGYILHTLKKTGLLAFACLVLSACKLYFNISLDAMLQVPDLQSAKAFMNDMVNYYCFESFKGDFRGWINVLGKYKPVINHPVLWPVGWAVELHSQLRVHGPEFPFILKNALRNIRAMTRKMKVIWACRMLV